jgi:hypothetical protein
MIDSLKNVLTAALGEKCPEIKKITLLPNECSPNNFDCVVNIKYEDFLRLGDKEIKELIRDYAKYLGVEVDTFSFY